MRHWILWGVLLCSLTACQLSLGSSSSEIIAPQPTATQRIATATTAAVSTVAPTARPTNTPPQVNTAVPLPACQRRTDWPTYSVASGDTLGKIAQRTSSDVATLTTANCLSNADQISVGQSLYVPRAPVALPPTTAPSLPPADNGFVVSALPANAACYLQIYGMMGSAVVRPSPDNTTTTLAAISMAFYYRIYSQTATHYEIAYNAQGHGGWVEKTSGTSVGDCRVLTQAPVTTATIHYNGLAFDYPSNWYSGFNIDGLPGGFVGTIRMSDIPPAAQPWSNDMVLVGYTLYPEGIVPNDLETAARQELENWRQGERNKIIQEVTPFTTASGYSGFVFEYTGPMTGARTYYLRINTVTVSLNISGNRALADSVVNSIRADS